MKKINYTYILLVILFIILFSCFNVNKAYADRGDNTDQSETVKNIGKAIWVSDFEGGYIDTTYNILDQNGNKRTFHYINYKCALGPATAYTGYNTQSTSNTFVYLYNLRNTKQDEELRQAREKGELGMSSIFVY